MYVCNQTDMYGFKSLLDNQDLSLFQEQLDKIERFLTSVSINRKNTKALLLLEGVSGTGKSQIVMDYIGKTK
jgi:ABC-type dipeptide/oligopeptide/nickel transport system ATPase subunit